MLSGLRWGPRRWWVNTHQNQKAERRGGALASGRRRREWGHTAPTLRITSEAARLGCGPGSVGLRGPFRWASLLLCLDFLDFVLSLL